jgi:hypothetical protein
VIGRDHLDSGSVASPYRETEAMADGSDAIADWPLLNAMVNVASGATWVSIHHGGGVGMGRSIHAGQVCVADGTDLAREKLERVLTNDPGTGVIRHADAGYDRAVEVADERGVRIPMREGDGALVTPPRPVRPDRRARHRRPGARGGAARRPRDAALAVEDGEVAWVGARRRPAADERVDVDGRCVLPGFVDSHAHLVFAGDRAGTSSPGWPASLRRRRHPHHRRRDPRRVRRELLANARRLVDELHAQGVTTFETKSGYGLTVADEARSLGSPVS